MATLRRVRLWSNIILLCFAVLETLSQLHAVNPDAISYLDLGSAFWRGDPIWANGLWSPLYGILCVGLYKLLALSPAWQFAVCHLVNLGLYALALLAFNFLLSQLNETAPNSYLYVLSFAVFLEWNHSLLVWISPDLAITACFIFAVALVIRIKVRQAGFLSYYLLGSVLGVGYLFKSPMLPIGVMLLAASLFYLRPAKRTITGLLQASIVFLLIGALYAVPLSIRSGHLTVGESARLNYAWHVQKVAYIHWQGDAIHGQPIHPTQKIMDRPEVFSFGEPIKVTYAAYYDPSYWYAGIRTPFSIRDQADAFFTTFKEYGKLLFTWQNGALILTLCGLVTMGSAGGFRRYLDYYPLLVCCLLGLGLFSIVHVEARYVTAFPVVGWTILLACALSSQPKPEAFSRFLLAACVVVISGTLIGLVPELARGVASISSLGRADSNPDWVVARESTRLGMRRGDQIAALGLSFHHSFWARLGGYRIVAEVPAPLEYWISPVTTQEVVNEKLRSAGARFLIAADVPSGVVLDGWRRIGSTGYFVRSLTR